MVRSLGWSFTNADLLARNAALMRVGNYSELLTDSRFRRAFANTAVFALLVSAPGGGRFPAGAWVNRRSRMALVARVFFVPVVISMPVLAVLWTCCTNLRRRNMGFVNAALGLLASRASVAARSPVGVARIASCRCGKAWDCR